MVSCQVDGFLQIPVCMPGPLVVVIVKGLYDHVMMA